AFDGNRFMRDGNLVKRAQESSSRDGWPPMLLIQGTADSMVPKKTAQDMAQALRAVEADVRLLFLEGHYHQFQLNAPAADAIATFLSKFTA
ncbi:ANK1, partial [Symbiodinium sp. KB8]